MNDVLKMICIGLSGFACVVAVSIFLGNQVVEVSTVRYAALGIVLAIANIAAIVLPWRTND